MNISQTGIALIKHFESLELSAYPDPGSDLGKACAAKRLPMRDYRKIVGWEVIKGDPWTIGYGHTGGIVPGMVWTPADAESNLFADLAPRCKNVYGLLKIPASQCQFDALVSFAYNVGEDIDADDIAEGLGDSTLLRYFNMGLIQRAADEFPKWDKSGGKVQKGLVLRRAAERALFLGMDWKSVL